MTITDSMFYAVSLLLTDSDFLQKHHEAVEHEDFPEGPLRNLIRFALHHYKEYGHHRLTRAALDAYLENTDPDDAAEMGEAFTYCLQLGQEVEAFDLLREKAEAWLQARWVGRALDEAKTALSAGDTEGALSAMQQAERQVHGAVEPPWELRTALGPVLVRKLGEAIPTGVEPLDEVLEGGLRPAEFGIIMGHTNVGKSMLTAMLAASAYLGNKRVVYFTSELTREQVVKRTAAAMFKQPIDKLTDPTLYEAVLDHIVEKAGLTNAGLYVSEMPPTLTALKAELAALPEPPDLLILDTADDIAPARKSQRLYEELGSVYKALRLDFAQGMRLSIWTSTQTNREAVDRAKVSLRHIGDSFIKAQRAHLVVGMAQTDQEYNAPFGPVLRLTVLKDTLHGAKGKGWRFQADFGPKEKVAGYPGLRVEEEGF